MQIKNLPRLDWLYWLTLALASVFGTNTGDAISHTLHLGDYKGLPVLALMFVAIVVAERRARMPSTLYYWLAIIVMRTAATNLADLATLQAELDYESTIAVLAAMLVLILLARRWIASPADRAAARAAGVPSTSGLYWLGMLAAATLGTALGDYGSHTLTLHVSVLVTLACLALALVPAVTASSDTGWYWLAIVAARTAGTNVGDLIAFKRGLNLGLPMALLFTGALFLAAVLISDRRAAGLRRAGLVGDPA